jgi:hypothetical protein
MASENGKCALCGIAPRRNEDSLLCPDCADAVNRVMSADAYEENLDRDRQAQLAQARLFIQAARGRG